MWAHGRTCVPETTSSRLRPCPPSSSSLHLLRAAAAPHPSPLAENRPVGDAGPRLVPSWGGSGCDPLCPPRCGGTIVATAERSTSAEALGNQALLADRKSASAAELMLTCRHLVHNRAGLRRSCDPVPRRAARPFLLLIAPRGRVPPSSRPDRTHGLGAPTGEHHGPFLPIL